MANTETKFSKNHVPWNKGIKGLHLSPQSEFKLGMVSPNKSKKMPQKSGVLHWNWKGVKFCECGKKKSSPAKNCQECANKKISIRMKGNKHGLGHKVSEESKKLMAQIRVEKPNRVFKDTKIEIAIENLLKVNHIDYKKQVPLCKVTISDFFLETFRIAIFCDGCYWHGCTEHRSIPDVINLNKYQNSVLAKDNISVLRFWEHDIQDKPEECIKKIINLINFKVHGK